MNANIKLRWKRWFAWLGTLGVGHAANLLMVWSFDWGLYPYIIWYYGLWLGGLIMMCLSFLFCWGTIIFYDWAKKDWLGIEMLKDLRDNDPKSLIGRMTAWAMRKGDLAMMIFLSIQFDPFITVCYMRHGANWYNGLSRRDWKIFIGSLLIGNAYWTLAMFMGISLVEFVWKMISKGFTF